MLYICHVETQTLAVIFAHKPVSEWCDDKALCAAGVFVAVIEIDVSDLHQAAVSVLHEIEPGLLQPLEVVRRLDVHSTLQTISDVDWVLGLGEVD